jgi:hypothetical protein
VRSQERLARIKRDYVNGDLSAADFQEFRGELTAELEAAESQVNRLESQRQALAAELGEVDVESAVLRELAGPGRKALHVAPDQRSRHA